MYNVTALPLSKLLTADSLQTASVKENLLRENFKGKFDKGNFQSWKPLTADSLPPNSLFPQPSLCTRKKGNRVQEWLAQEVKRVRAAAGKPEIVGLFPSL